MKPSRFNLIQDNKLRLRDLNDLSRKPELFAPGEALFWDDPHISRQMLAAHLDPTTEAASRPPDVIDDTVDWLMTRLGLQPGDPVLDLGCGPGLYCTRFASHGLAVTGIDYSQVSLDHARHTATEDGLTIEYRYQDYLTLDQQDAYRVILLIYGDLCVLPDNDRDHLLNRVHRALQPGGYFVFDVSTPHARRQLRNERYWAVESTGFWRPSPYVQLEEVFDYPEESVSMRQVAIIEESGELNLYRLWFHYYTGGTVTALVEQHRFTDVELYSDLAGTPYVDTSEWIGIIARKPN